MSSRKFDCQYAFDALTQSLIDAKIRAVSLDTAGLDLKLFVPVATIWRKK